MPEIPLPQPDENNPDIYSLGYDRNLNKQGATKDASIVNDVTEPSAIPGAVTFGSESNNYSVDPKQGIWLGAVKFADAPFSVDMAGNMVASAGSISGTLTAGQIHIPNSTQANSFHVAGGETYGGDTWWGANVANGTISANAYVLNTGQAAFKNVALSNAVSISGIANNTSTDISLLTYTYTMVFSASDNDTVAWTAGTITMSNGRTFAIDAGNTGNMAALSWIYLDTGVSSTVLQVTTTAATAMGANKIPLAIAQNNADTSANATFVAQGGTAGIAVTAGSIKTATLAAITADLGSITAGTVTGATIRTAASGTRFSMNSTSFQGINSAGDVIFEVIISGGDAGDVIMGKVSSGNYAKWDDSAGTFTVFGAGASADVQTFTASGTWTKPSRGTIAFCQVWGAGGGGAGSNSGTGCGGGGGGAYIEKWILLSSLGATETVTIGAGGAGASAGDGSAGGNTTFGSQITAYGGGGGGFTTLTNSGGGGGGGGVTSAGTSSTADSGGAGGGIAGGAGGAGGDPSGTSGSNGGTAGGGGGGGGGGVQNGAGGGASYSGGGGGGGGGQSTSAGGGASYSGGGGGGGVTDTSGSSGGTSVIGGAGGAGVSGGAGTAGTQPGGGGGASETSTGGAGGAGKVIVTVI